jgi:hypothetical protein
VFCPGAHLSRTLQSRCKTIAATWTEFQIAAPGLYPARPNHLIRTVLDRPARNCRTPFFRSVSEKGRELAVLTVNGNIGALRMSENILGFPALQIEPGPRRQESETGLRQFQPAFARKHCVQALAQRVQMQNVGGRVSELRFA